MMRLLRPLLCLWLAIAAPTLAAPISSYPAASTLTGTEKIIATQGVATVNITPAQLGAYVGTSAVTTGPYTGQIAQTLATATQNGCLNIFSYLTAAQQASVQAGTSTQDFGLIISSAVTALSVNPIASTYTGTNTICLPPGKYPIKTTVNLKHTVTIQGAGGNGLGGFGYATWLQVDPNLVGFIINAENTTGNGQDSPSTTSASGTIFRDLAIFGGSSPSGPAKCGTWATCAFNVRARAGFDNVTVNWNSGTGINVSADTGGSAAILGNANGSSFRNVAIVGNNTLVNGITFRYGDANAGLTESVQCANLLGWCIDDSSFLGNTHIMPQSATAGQGAYVKYSGTAYVAYPTTTSALLASTTPGTDATVWTAQGAAGSQATWVNGGTYYTGGDFRCLDTNGRCTFIGAYSEGGSPVNYVGPVGLVMGGISANGTAWIGTGAVLYGSGTFVSNNGVASGGASFGPATIASTGILGYTDANWSQAFRMMATGGDIEENYQNAGAFRYLVRTSPATALTFGRTAIVPYAVSIGKFFLSDGGGNPGAGNSNGRALFNGTAIPSTTGNAVGEIEFNRTPSVGSSLGWTETVQGSPDTWQPFGIVGAVQAAAQVDTTAADLAALKVDFNALLAKLRTAKLVAP